MVAKLVSASSCYISFQVQSDHGSTLSVFDVRECIKQAEAREALFLEYNRETSTVHVGYDTASSVDALCQALDQRLVILGQSVKVRLSVEREARKGILTAASREWEDNTLEEGEVDSRSGLHTLVCRRLPCKWFGITAAEEGVLMPVAQADGLREQMKTLLATIPTRIEVVFLPGDLLMDVYIQLSHMAEVEKVLARSQGKALRYETSKVVLPLVVEVDLSGFFAEAQINARLAVQERESQARQTLQKKRLRLWKERKELAALLKTLQQSYEDDEGNGEDESGGRAGIRTELASLSGTLAEAASMGDAMAVLESGRMAAQSTLTKMEELQHHCRRGLAAVDAELLRLREGVQEKRRLDEVREVRVTQARALKESDHRWRVGLEALALPKEVRKTNLCDHFTKITESALTQARNLVLKEAHRIVNLEEYFQRLQWSLKDADQKVGSTLRLLRIDANAREVEESFKELCKSMERVGEGTPPKRRDSRDGNEGVPGILPPFLQCPCWAATYRKALAAALLLNERRHSEDIQNNDECRANEFVVAFRELDGHIRRLRPAWDLFTKLQDLQVRQKKLQSVYGTYGEGDKEGERKEKGGREETHFLETSNVALQAAVAHLVNISKQEDNDVGTEMEAALGSVQQAVVAAELAIAKEKGRQRMRAEVLRRLAEERALERVNRDEGTRVNAREEAMGLLKLERLERRRKHLEASLRMEEARERLEEMRAAGLLSFPETLARGCHDEVGDAVTMSVMGVEGSEAVVIAPAPIENWERWSMVKMEAGPPLNLTWPSFVPNLVAADYWTKKGEQSSREVAYSGYLRSEVIVVRSGAIAEKRHQSNPFKSPRVDTKETAVSSHEGWNKRHKREFTDKKGESPSSRSRSVVVMAT